MLAPPVSDEAGSGLEGTMTVRESLDQIVEALPDERLIRYGRTISREEYSR